MKPATAARKAASLNCSSRLALIWRPCGLSCCAVLCYGAAHVAVPSWHTTSVYRLYQMLLHICSAVPCWAC